MAIQKVLGIETEYGIIVRGGDSNPIAASSILINAYVQGLARAGAATGASRVGWDFEDEQPGNDARGFNAEGQMPPEVETHLVNAVLTNGARYYVDHAHPELSTPECADPRSIVVYDRAAELILHRSMAAATELLPAGQEIVVYKNNSDRKGNSYGTHENYLMDRAVPFSKIVRYVMPHFITRQIYTGAGKVGSEAPGLTSADVPYQLTQRADFFEEEVGLETTLKRPIVNTRDEPHADAQKYRRLHVIVGDANLSEVATFLKVGTTALVLSMIEDDWLTRDLLPAQAGPGPPAGLLRHDPRSPHRPGRRHVDHRAGRAVGAVRPRPQVRARSTAWTASVARRSATRCSAAGRRSSPGWRPTPRPSPARWTGSPSTGCSTATASGTTSGGTTLAWPRWTCSTTTCARRSRWRRGWASSGSPPTRRWPTRCRSLRMTPGPSSAVGACSAGPRASSPPTGTRWSSTSVAIRSAVCP